MPQIAADASPVSLPPASAEYRTVMHSPPGKSRQVRKWKMFRSTQGATRLDFGKTGLISKPGGSQTILLDHVKREARIVPAPAHPQSPSQPAAPGPGGTPHPPMSPSMPQVKDLGKRMIGGHPAEGKMYTFKPPKVPKLATAAGNPLAGPGKPPMPGPLPSGVVAPALGKPMAAATSPALGKPPAPDTPEGKVQTLEVWTHTELKVPLLTKAGGMPGLHHSVCKCVKGGEAAVSLFQIPPGYKLVGPQPALPPSPRM